MVRGGKLFHQLDVERLYETHVGDRRVQRLRRVERRLEHRAEGKDGDALALPAQLSFTNGNGGQLVARLAKCRAAWVAHCSWRVEPESGCEHLPAFGGVGGR